MGSMIGFITAARLAEEVEELDRDLISPGVAGFLFTALIAVGVIFLGFDLVRRLRRNRFREEIREALTAEIAERDAAAGVESDSATGSETTAVSAAGADVATEIDAVAATDVDPNDKP